MECSRRKALYQGRRIRPENPQPTRLSLSGTLAPEVLVRLNAQLRLTVHLHQVILENRLRDVDRREDVRHQTYNQCNGETADWSGPEHTQKYGRNDSRDVSIDNRQKGFVKTGINGGRRGLTITQFLSDTLKDEDVGVHTHADGQDDASDTGKRQHSAGHGEKRQENDQVEKQSQHGVAARKPIIDQHEEHNNDETEHRSLHAVADGVRSEGWAYRALLKILNGSGQRARPEYQRQFVCAILAEVSFNHARVFDAAINHGSGLDLMIEDNGHFIANILFRERPKALGGFRRKREIHLPHAGVGSITRFDGAAEVAAGDYGSAIEKIPNFALVGNSVGAAAFR